MRIIIIPFYDIVKHGLIIDLAPLLDKLLIASLGSYLGRSGEEYLDLRLRQHDGADVSAVHDAAVSLGYIALKIKEEGSDLRHSRNIRSRH